MYHINILRTTQIGNSIESSENLNREEILLNTTISKAGLNSISKKHTWYLCEELVPLALYSDMVIVEEKEMIDDRLLQLGFDRDCCKIRDVMFRRLQVLD